MFLLLFKFSFLFRKSFRKTRVFLQETLTHRGQQNQQMPEMRSRAGGNPSQGCQSVRNLGDRLSPPGTVPTPRDPPKIITFPSRFLPRLKELFGLPRWTLGEPLGVPMAPLSSRMAPKMVQNGHQNVSQKAPRTQNSECEQIILFVMFQTHFGPPKRLENVPFFFQNPALVALATLWPPGCPQ